MSGGGGSESAVMASREAPPFNVVPTSVVTSSQIEQQMHLSFAGYGPPVPVGSSPGNYPAIPAIPAAALINQVSGGGGEQLKRKRGRPRKYGPDGNMAGGPPLQHQQPIAPAVMPQNFSSLSSPPPAVATAPQQPMHTDSQMPSLSGSVSPTVKKARGRPPGSSNKKQKGEKGEPLGSTGIGFIPHILHVQTGEDVAAKIMAFSQNGPRAVCVLSASGTIANVTLRQAATSGGTATYEGRYDVLSLSGSFTLTEVGGQKTRTGGLSITLAGSEGRVFGGCVAGVLLAASAVQVIVGSFLAESPKDQRAANHMEPSSGPRVNLGGIAGASSSPSRGTLSESSGGAGSPFNHSSGNNLGHGMAGLPWK